MTRRRVALGALLAAALAVTPAAGATIPSLSAKPAQQGGIDLSYRIASVPTGTGCRVNFYVVVAGLDGSTVSQTRRYSSTACLSSWRQNIAAPPQAGQYDVCLITLNNDNFGQILRQRRCTRITIG